MFIIHPAKGVLKFSFIIWQPGYRVGAVYSERIFLKSTRTSCLHVRMLIYIECYMNVTT